MTVMFVFTAIIMVMTLVVFMTAAIVVVVMTVMFVFTAIIMVMMLVVFMSAAIVVVVVLVAFVTATATAVVFFALFLNGLFFSRAHNIYSPYSDICSSPWSRIERT